MNILNKTRIYLAGQMQYMDGQPWRNYVQKELEEIGITVFNPYDKPFVNSRLEDKNTHQWLRDLMDKGEYDEVESYMRLVRTEDLRICDLVDFAFCYVNPKYPTVGTWEEMTTLNRAKKPIFFVTESGKQNTPYWVLGMIPHKYIYGSIDEALDIIRQINSGEKEIDSGRWRLLKDEYR